MTISRTIIFCFLAICLSSANVTAQLYTRARTMNSTVALAKQGESSCSDNAPELSGPLCYAPCRAGYHGVGPLCSKQCPSHTVEMGGSCWKMIYPRKPSFPSECPGDSFLGTDALCLENCKEGYSTTLELTCLQNCPSGYTNIGVACTKGRQYFVKDQYVRHTSLPSCPKSKEQIMNLCYDPCEDGYISNLGPECSAMCPNGFTDHGVFCEKDSYIRDVGALPKCFKLPNEPAFDPNRFLEISRFVNSSMDMIVSVVSEERRLSDEFCQSLLQKIVPLPLMTIYKVFRECIPEKSTKIPYFEIGFTANLKVASLNLLLGWARNRHTHVVTCYVASSEGATESKGRSISFTAGVRKDLPTAGEFELTATNLDPFSSDFSVTYESAVPEHTIEAFGMSFSSSLSEMNELTFAPPSISDATWTIPEVGIVKFHDL